jgi:hypothetical protein
MGAITRNHKGKLIEIGGMPDHVHLLIELSSFDKYSDFLRTLKLPPLSGFINRILILLILPGKRVLVHFLLAILLWIL